MCQRPPGRVERRKAALIGFTTCSTHAVLACYAPIPREANSNHFDTSSAAVAFDLLQHCWRGQEAERLRGSPLQCSYPHHREHWGLLGPLQASATGQSPGMMVKSGLLPRQPGNTLTCCLSTRCSVSLQGAHREWLEFRS